MCTPGSPSIRDSTGSSSLKSFNLALAVVLSPIDVAFYERHFNLFSVIATAKPSYS